MKAADPRRLVFDPSLLSDGNRVRLLNDGAEAFPRMLEAIAGARQSILVEMYTFASDTTGKKFAEALVERAKAGVTVRVLYDGLGSRETATSIFQSMRAAGAGVTPFRPLGWFSWRRRDHRKIVIVDGTTAFLGGMNFTDEYAPVSDGGQGWHDVQIEIEGPEVADLVTLFAQTWAQEEDDPLFPTGYPQKAKPRPGGVLVAAIGSDHRPHRKAIGNAYLHALRNAEKRVWIANAYFVPSLKFHRAIRQAAARGVDVRILAPVKTDVQPVYYASRALFDGLLRRGIRIFEYQGPILHAKTIVIDGVWSSIGSYNLDHLSILRNLEVTAIVLDEKFGACVEALFEKDCTNSIEVKLAEWRKRSPRRMLLEQFWFQFRSLL
ncbi:MAG TPA: phospholipase D-like domain-containing protein [Planctomycetota bacterium]|nr:phospholipase D-like domain-containing protein [Planctomycetota bacterium]